MTNAIEAGRKRLIRVLVVVFVAGLVLLAAEEFGLLNVEVYERLVANTQLEKGMIFWLEHAGKILLLAAIPALAAGMRPKR